jgi:menaquinone-9 beta-reductase
MRDAARDYDAVVLGAGPAGATTSLLLARAGWSVAVVEKAVFPRRKVCGEFMSATNAPLLREIGLDAAVRREAGPEVRRVGLFSGADRMEADMPQLSDVTAPWGRALGREVLDTALLSEAVAAGAVAWQPWKATVIAEEPRGHAVAIASGREAAMLTARLVVAAHGSWEAGTLPTQVAAPHRPTDLLAFKARFTQAALAPGLMSLLAFPGGYGGMVESNGGRVTLSCCIQRDRLQAAREKYPGAAGAAVLAHVMASCTGVAAALEGAELDGTWLSAGPIRPGVRECYHDGIFRAGNCAAEAHPIVAEGISMALQAGWLLGSLLVEADARRGGRAILDSVGADYTPRFRRLFAPRIQAAGAFATLALSPSAAALARPLLRRFPGLLSFGAGLSGKTRLIDAEMRVGAVQN